MPRREALSLGDSAAYRIEGRPCMVKAVAMHGFEWTFYHPFRESAWAKSSVACRGHSKGISRQASPHANSAAYNFMSAMAMVRVTV